MKIAIYGGTFDPIHRGHLEVAQAAAKEFDLDRILFVPTGCPPHRRRPPEADYEHRYQLVASACQQDSRFVPSRLEASDQRKQYHYSIDTIQHVKAELKPGERLFFLMGSDSFAEISLWRRWREIMRLVEFIVVSRPGEELPQQDVPEGAKVHWLRTVHVPISSTEIRERLRSGQSADEWLPAEVAAYIRKHGLYQGEVTS